MTISQNGARASSLSAISKALSEIEHDLLMRLQVGGTRCSLRHGKQSPIPDRVPGLA